MAEKEQKTLTPRELTELLVKHADIHDGFWGLVIEFGFGAANIPIAGSSDEYSLKPTALVSVNKVGIQKFEQPAPLTVDAAKLNPATPAQQQHTRSKKPQIV